MHIYTLASLAALCARVAAVNEVFAHYIVGLTYGQTRDEWQLDISQAKGAGIDGFALNIGSQDSQNHDQLEMAYEVAADNDFLLFLSFDMAASQWDAGSIANNITAYKDLPAQFKIDGRPVVSTFEGPSQAGDWAGIRGAVGGGIYLIPDWASLGAQGVGSKLDLIDGAFNWGAWPEANQDSMSTGNDVAYKSVLQGKPYMMGVSPWFYTYFPGAKTWYSSSESLWFDRWQQVLDIKPELIEIITWNDYGESSYLNEPRDHQLVAGSEVWAQGVDHSAFRFVLPYFIKAYKAGSADVDLPNEGAVAWYRTTPAKVCSDGGAVWGQGGSASAADGAKDVVSIIALTNSAADVKVTVGGVEISAESKGSFGKASFYEASFGGNAGAVTVTVNGKSTTGAEITNNCPSSGRVSFNAVTIEVDI
ncbi:glycoside hydrolase family 71 protein [Xylariaceae sp. FL0594]|nr:glycoside hydrolase family 71 protein [Xylariaceae sp. FL0594]